MAGGDLVHLQCHTGLDTLSWLRAGARSVTGVDFSDVAIAKATATAGEAGLANRATFRTADVLDLPADLDARFDVSYASRGVLTWISDLGAWMHGAARLLRPGGHATAHNTTVEYGHSLADVVTAALDAGLGVEHLGEHAAAETDANRHLATREPDGLIRWRHTGQLLPVMFSLRVRKPTADS